MPTNHKCFKKYLVVGTVLVSSAVSANNYPDWAISPPAEHASYCMPVRGTVEDARKAATLMAGLELGDNTELSEVISEEKLNPNGEDYSLRIDSFRAGAAPIVELVTVQEVDDQLCVLVRRPQ